MEEEIFVLQHRIGSLWLDSGKESPPLKIEDLEKIIKNSDKEYRIQKRIKNQYNPKRKSCC